MQTILFLILDLILAAIAYFLYLGVFIPQIEKNALYAKMKAKEKAELDRRIGNEQYFNISHKDEEIKIKIK